MGGPQGQDHPDHAGEHRPVRLSVQRVAIVTDSSSCLPPEVAAGHGIEVVPIEMVFEGRIYRDGVDDPGDFYRLLRTAKALPKTAAPSPGLFLQAISRARQRGESVLCITLPANLSSIHNSSQQAAMLAKEESPGLKVVSMESGAVAAGQGLLVLEAARAAERGMSLEEVAAQVREMGPQVHFFAMLDTLEYLAKGGHVPKVAAWLGNMVGLRPILTAPNGDVKRISQARSRRGALEKIMRLMEERDPDTRPIQALVMHADAPAEAEALRAKIASRFQCAELLVTRFTPVMGAHSGPGVLGVAFRVV